MKILTEECCNELVVKNSRFISEAFVVTSQAEARERLHSQKTKYSDARHVCHAFVVGKNGEVCGMSDDGEPSGTAGHPMLDVLKGSQITNIIITVTRYFGGILLGTGGLVRAYSESVKALLNICKTEDLIEKVDFCFEAEYNLHALIKKTIESFHISSLSVTFTSSVLYSGSIWLDEVSDFSSAIKNLTKGRSSVITS